MMHFTVSSFQTVLITSRYGGKLRDSTETFVPGLSVAISMRLDAPSLAHLEHVNDARVQWLVFLVAFGGRAGHQNQGSRDVVPHTVSDHTEELSFFLAM